MGFEMKDEEMNIDIKKYESFVNSDSKALLSAGKALILFLGLWVFLGSIVLLFAHGIGMWCFMFQLIFDMIILVVEIAVLLFQRKDKLWQALVLQGIANFFMCWTFLFIGSFIMYNQYSSFALIFVAIAVVIMMIVIRAFKLVAVVKNGRYLAVPKKQTDRATLAIQSLCVGLAGGIVLPRIIRSSGVPENAMLAFAIVIAFTAPVALEFGMTFFLKAYYKHKFEIKEEPGWDT
jgi:hypothetical protein